MAFTNMCFRICPLLSRCVHNPCENPLELKSSGYGMYHGKLQFEGSTLKLCLLAFSVSCCDSSNLDRLGSVDKCRSLVSRVDFESMFSESVYRALSSPMQLCHDNKDSLPFPWGRTFLFVPSMRE